MGKKIKVNKAFYLASLIFLFGNFVTPITVGGIEAREVQLWRANNDPDVKMQKCIKCKNGPNNKSTQVAEGLSPQNKNLVHFEKQVGAEPLN